MIERHTSVREVLASRGTTSDPRIHGLHAKCGKGSAYTGCRAFTAALRRGPQQLHTQCVAKGYAPQLPVGTHPRSCRKTATHSAGWVRRGPRWPVRYGPGRRQGTGPVVFRQKLQDGGTCSTCEPILSVNRRARLPAAHIPCVRGGLRVQVDSWLGL